MLHERAPRFSDALAELPDHAGEGDVAEQLVQVARAAVPFYRRSFPMAASLFASPDLLAAHRQKLDIETAGPQKATEHLARYLGAEQRLGRVAPTVGPDAAAELLIGACVHRAFLPLFFAPGAPDDTLRPENDERFAQEIVRTLSGHPASRPEIYRPGTPRPRR
ncbi:TetR/AcrR family transcriptional regulator C-terminal domain-containing protein [Kitasatospora sp. GP82]|uniref:TetR/AcrR family transcriptional regulator C-terminal domain-containing protein n=1 Tax=Kitasatospora sp. GP82 TaxID=3035089 RepID=UPI002474482D|nr:TetR/AcrR family transcriptional regulator C-terminal domain-containing protein [Kitasatospora sp. GP82]MDH6128319.1 hypothetical protein [Kitasatospora sp. GP82]